VSISDQICRHGGVRARLSITCRRCGAILAAVDPAQSCHRFRLSTTPVSRIAGLSRSRFRRARFPWRASAGKRQHSRFRRFRRRPGAAILFVGLGSHLVSHPQPAGDYSGCRRRPRHAVTIGRRPSGRRPALTSARLRMRRSASRPRLRGATNSNSSPPSAASSDSVRYTLGPRRSSRVASRAG